MPVEKEGKTVWVKPGTEGTKEGSFESKDTSKSYYGEVVRQTSSGKIRQVGSAGEVIDEARAQAEAEAQAKEELLRKEQRIRALNQAEVKAREEQIKKEQASRQQKLINLMAYQEKIREEGGVRITGEETTKEIKKISEASGISEKELTKAVTIQKLKREAIERTLEKQREAEAERLKGFAEKIFEQEPQRDIVRIKTEKGIYEFEKGKVNSSGSTYSALKPEEFETTKQITTQKEAEKYFYEKESPKRAGVFIKLEEAQERYKDWAGDQGALTPYTTFISGTSSGLIGLSKSVAHPVKTAKGVVYAVTHPAEVGAQIGERLQNEPVYFFGEITGFYAGTKVIGLGLKGVKTGIKAGIRAFKGTKTVQYGVTYGPVKLHIGKTSVTQKIKTDLKPGQLTEYQRAYMGYTYGERAQPVTVSTIKQTGGVSGKAVGLGKTQYISLQTKKYYIQATSKPGLIIDNKLKVSYPGYISNVKYISKTTGGVVKTKTIFTPEGIKPGMEGLVKSKEVSGVNWRKLLTTKEGKYLEAYDVGGGKFKQTSYEIKVLSKSQVKQIDTATNFELKTTTYNIKGGEPSIYYEIKQPEIVYAKSPTYNPNIYSIKPYGDYIEVTYIKEPTLTTTVKATSISKFYAEAETKLKPLGKKSELQLGGTTQRIEKINILTPERTPTIKTDIGLINPELIKDIQAGIPKTEMAFVYPPLIKPKTEAETKLTQSIKTGVKITPTKTETPTTEIVTKPETETKPETKTKAVVRTIQTQIPEIETPETEIIQKQIIKTPFEFINIPTPVTPPPVVPGFFAKDIELFKKPEKFSILARRRGQFREIGQAETIQEAFVKGSHFVDVTSSASFKIEPIGFDFDVGRSAKQYLPEIFRESKREPGVFIEKRAFRISTPGEKKEITEKGLLALKSKIWRL